MSALARLQSSKDIADKVQADRENYAAYVELMRETGWTEEDVIAYRMEVERIMKHGMKEEKEAASTFWAEYAPKSVAGINQRMRESIEREKAMKEAA